MSGRRGRSVGVLLLFLVTPIGVGIPAGALVARADAFLDFTTNDNVCHLHYTYWGHHQGRVLQFSAPEAVFPVLFRGIIKKGALSDVSSCTRTGVVATTPWFCSTSYSAWCPSVQGVYVGDSRLAITGPSIVTIYTDATGPSFANCWSCPPTPPPCGGPSSLPWQTAVIELVTGREVRLRDAPSDRLIRSVRNDMDSEKEYIVEQWAILDGARNIVASSAEPSSPGWLHDSPDIPSGTPVLVIEAPIHRGTVAAPLVRVERSTMIKAVESIRRVPTGEQLIVVRLDFSPRGDLRDSATLMGPEEIGRALGAAVSLDAQHAHHGETHRTVVFAVFDVGSSSAELVTARAYVPQCCCGEFFCY